MTEPRLLLLDEPTRGVDVGAKGEIYARIRGFADQGLGVLIASSEMPELLGLCDRVVVLRSGCSVAEFPAGRTSGKCLPLRKRATARRHDRSLRRRRARLMKTDRVETDHD